MEKFSSLWIDRMFPEGSLSDKEQIELEALIEKFQKGALSTPLIDTFSSHTLQTLTQNSFLVHEKRIYLRRNWEYSERIFQEIQRIQSGKMTLFDADQFFLKLEKADLAPSQKKALEKGFSEPFFCLVGGPGTGKTYTASLFVSLLASSLISHTTLYITIAAPTGKAASQLLESIQKTEMKHLPVKLRASTLHRALGTMQGKRLDADLILIDEASMIGAPLMLKLLQATGINTRLHLIGDPHQLPPVESLPIFPEITKKYAFFLNETLRVESSHLKQFAEAILGGKREEILPFLKDKISAIHKLPWKFDFSLAEKLFSWIQPILSDVPIDPEKALAHYRSFRILNGLRQGPFGADQLNQKIAKLVEEREEKWRAIPILITANDPYLDLYNGMTGVCIVEKGKESEAKAYFPGKKEALDRLAPFQEAYCLSIHKSQGSEFESVLTLFPEGSEIFGKEALYTALTRARKNFTWMGKEETLLKMASFSAQED